MKFVHSELSGKILDENMYCVQWIIESPALFKMYVGELFLQSNGGEGKFILSQNGKEIDVAKKVEVVIDPFSINLNDRRILNKLYTELEVLLKGDDLFFDTQLISQQIYEYLLKLEQKMEAVLDINMELDWASVFKAAGIKYAYEMDTGCFLEYILNYVKILNDILKKELFAFINMRSYLEDGEMEMLVKELAYREIHAVFIENQDRGCLNNLQCYIIDKDKCEIY